MILLFAEFQKSRAHANFNIHVTLCTNSYTMLQVVTANRELYLGCIVHWMSIWREIHVSSGSWELASVHVWCGHQFSTPWCYSSATWAPYAIIAGPPRRASRMIRTLFFVTCGSATLPTLQRRPGTAARFSKCLHTCCTYEFRHWVVLFQHSTSRVNSIP